MSAILTDLNQIDVWIVFVVGFLLGVFVMSLFWVQEYGNDHLLNLPEFDPSQHKDGEVGVRQLQDKGRMDIPFRSYAAYMPRSHSRIRRNAEAAKRLGGDK